MHTLKAISLTLVLVIIAGCGGERSDSASVYRFKQRVKQDNAILASQHKDVKMTDREKLVHCNADESQFVRSLKLNRPIRYWGVLFPKGSEILFWESEDSCRVGALNELATQVNLPKDEITEVGLAGQTIEIFLPHKVVSFFDGGEPKTNFVLTSSGRKSSSMTVMTPFKFQLYNKTAYTSEITFTLQLTLQKLRPQIPRIITPPLSWEALLAFLTWRFQKGGE